MAHSMSGEGLESDRAQATQAAHAASATPATPATTATPQAQAAQSQWLRGVTDLLLLACLDREPSYGYALAETLIKAGIEPISEATVYGALRRLETSGLCASRLVASDAGPARRYYELTAQGRHELGDLGSRWNLFSAAVSHLISDARR